MELSCLLRDLKVGSSCFRQAVLRSESVCEIAHYLVAQRVHHANQKVGTSMRSAIGIE